MGALDNAYLLLISCISRYSLFLFFFGWWWFGTRYLLVGIVCALLVFPCSCPLFIVDFNTLYHFTLPCFTTSLYNLTYVFHFTYGNRIKKLLAEKRKQVQHQPQKIHGHLRRVVTGDENKRVRYAGIKGKKI